MFSMFGGFVGFIIEVFKTLVIDTIVGCILGPVFSK